MILEFILTLTLVGSVVGKEQLWAIQLTTQHEEAAEEVASELGMMVIGKVFDDVFLLRGEVDRDDSGGDDQVKSGSKLHHPKILWAEQQTGHRRTSRYKIVEEKVKNQNDGKSARAKYTMGRQPPRSIPKNKNHFGRMPRDVGGLNRKPLKSPWSFQRARDPLRWRQWYLGPGGGMHLNVTSLWAAGIRGGGISVAILDDGVELTHLDLALNYDPAASWDLLDSDPDPMPVSWSRHGTQLAGIIAATHFNGMCGMGVAPWSGVGAVRMLGYVVYDAVEAAALSYERDHVDVYVAAWGPVDTGAVMEGPGVLASRAVRESIALGRNGLGSIYVWASGNGGYVGDDCNADGYSNSVYTLTVSGSTKKGRAPDYAETCAATFVSTYSGDADSEYSAEEQINGIVTTDLGGVCTDSFRGSSVSAAMVAGACALALDANPRLGWRDMQHLMVEAATPYNPLPSQWDTNGVGRMYSHYFGFGSLDAGKMVDLARNWKNVPPAFRCYAHSPHKNITFIPDETLILPISVSGCQIVQAEHIQVNISLSADNRGQIEIGLRSPSGTYSTLLPQRPLDLSPYGIQNHPLSSVHMWGEDPRGIWKIYITYHNSSILDQFGDKKYVTVPNKLHACSLIVHGTEVPIDQSTIYNHHYTETQLSEILLTKNTSAEMESTVAEMDNSPLIEVDYWTSPPENNTEITLFLFCRVTTSLPRYVTNIQWQTFGGETFHDAIRHLKGHGSRSEKYPAVLTIKKTENIKGNFTCKVSYNGEEYSRDVHINSIYSSTPHTTETVRVAEAGKPIILPCENLSPIIRGTWTKDGQQLQSSPRITITEDQLLIKNVTSEDAGVYECYKNASRLHYAHRSSITLLMAKGPSTLIQYYAIDSHPPIPQVKPQPSCPSINISEEEMTDTDSESLAVDTLGLPKKPCPPPYRPVEGHCLLIGAGPARPWHQAREQCRKRKGELLVVHDASLMLALIQLLHTQGLASKSFWVGGLRDDVDSWRWVDGIPMPMSTPFWFLTPTHQPQEVPIIQRNEERSLHDIGSRREVFESDGGMFMASTRPTASQTSLLRRLGIQKSSHSPRRGQMKRGTNKKRRRRRRSLESSAHSRPQHSRQTVSRTKTEEGYDLEVSGFADPASPEDETPTRRAIGNSRGNSRKKKSFPAALLQQRRTSPRNSTGSQSSRKPRPLRAKTRSGRPRPSNTSLSGTTLGTPTGSPPGPPLEEDPPSGTGAGGGSHPTQDTTPHPRDIYGQRAVCMWAGLRHFFGSCSVLERLSALCEYKET
ncbi:uncharacterized protein LOC135216183 [Macrobrachium nipponense]|uniref:uncharacterized protein LOC135216183 n=1 Tax=Macrobrachium nipponense TaxID=159736 RepID=UPI0030C868D0